jgi:hypothetical protein
MKDIKIKRMALFGQVMAKKWFYTQLWLDGGLEEMG